MARELGTDRVALLADFAASVDHGSLPADVELLSKACVLYGLAVGLAAVKMFSVAAIAEAAGGERSQADGPATRLSDGARLPVDEAVLCNATMLSSHAQGDSHPTGHFGGVVIPVALAIAEERKRSGKEFLATVVAGYEVGLRVGRDHAGALTEQGFRTTPCYGVFAAAGAAGRAMQMDGAMLAQGLRVAANFAGGTREFVYAGSFEYPYQAAVAARNGLLAARLASAGVQAAESALDGRAGFYRAYGGAPDVDYGERLTDALGSDFELRRVTYRSSPACQYVQGVISAMLKCRARVEKEQLPATITVSLCPFEAAYPGVANRGPFRSVTQTIASATFCAALAWLRGGVTYDGLERYGDREVVDLAERVTVRSEPMFGMYETRVECVFPDGQTVEIHDTAGPSSYAMSWDGAVDAATELCGSGLDDLIAAVAELDRADSVKDVVDAAVAAATGASRARPQVRR